MLLTGGCAVAFAIVGKKGRLSESWKVDPDEADYLAAAVYLSLLFPEAVSGAVVEGLRNAETTAHKATDLMRASGLPLLSSGDPQVAKELKKISGSKLLSPVLLVRGQARIGGALIVADGYHRICASYHLDVDASIPCRLADLP